MSGDYLWDRSGPPDPEVQRLERLLAPFSHAARPRRAPAARVGGSARVLMAAAILMVLLGAAVLLTPARRPAWEVARIDGQPRLGASPLTRGGRLAVGGWLQTDGSSRARLSMPGVGFVDVGPDSLVRLVAASREQRLALDRGLIEAVIAAPPRTFVVETPSATAVDLGCMYSLEVEPDGKGLLRVELGWVAFEVRGRESFVPAGAACRTFPSTGPGTPYFEDGTEAFRTALDALDAGSVPAQEAFADLLREARPKDSLTLWHLLSRAPSASRGAVFDRMAELQPPPAGVSKEGVVRGERRMLDAWWDALGHGDAAFWRGWTGSWP